MDQGGHRYRIRYHPDWLDRIRVTRRLASGRRSTMTLFRNPRRRPKVPVEGRVRARVESAAQGLDVEVSIGPEAARVDRVQVSWRGARRDDSDSGAVTLTLTRLSRAGEGTGDGG